MKVAPNLYPGLPDQVKSLIQVERRIDNPYLILQAISEYLNISLPELLSNSRKRPLVEARCIAVGLILQVKPYYGLKKLGELLGGKHHSSIIHLRQTFDNLYKRDKPFTKKVQEVLKYV